MNELDKRFVSAIVFCLAAESLGNPEDRERLARWALQREDPEDAAPTPKEAQYKVALVSGGATKIKGYVFESARLPEIRGASGLLDRINLDDTRRLWKDKEIGDIGCEDCIIYANGGEVLAFAPISKAAWLADEIERLYTRETLVAQSVAVYQIFTIKQLRDGLLAGERVDGGAVEKLLGYNPIANAAFGSLIAPLALAKFRRREANFDTHRNGTDSLRNLEARAIAHFETVPFARRCSSCERRAAVFNDKVAEDENRPLCEPCARKRLIGLFTKRDDAHPRKWYDAGFEWEPEPPGRPIHSWAKLFDDWLKMSERIELRRRYNVGATGQPLQDLHKVLVVRDLGEIAQASKPEGFIGVVYVDGNNMGQLLAKLKTPTEYATFADEVFEANKDAVFEALAENLQTTQIKRERGERITAHPFEILSIGGDDLFLLVPAHRALPIACAIAKNVERRLLERNQAELFKVKPGEPGAEGYVWEQAQRCRGVSPSAQGYVSLSAGVVIADAHTPIFYLEELASQLLKSAKRRAKWLKHRHQYYGGTVDFLALKSVTMLSGTVEEFRHNALTQPDHLLPNRRRQLYARPYTVAEMEALLDSVRLLKQSGFPRNQLYRLRDTLRRSKVGSTLDYLYFLSRNDGVIAARKEIEDRWTPPGKLTTHPWRTQLENQRHWETIWPDLIELYDFVPLEEKNANR